MPEGATRDAHAKVKERFTHLLGRYRKRYNVVIAIHATTHADPKSAHYDFVGFITGSNKKKVMTAIRNIWKQAGGLHPTVRPLKAEDVPAVTTYQNHPATRFDPIKNIQQVGHSDPQSDPKFVINREQVYLLKRVKDGGLKAYWHIGGFWLDTSAEEIWTELKSEWFPKTEDEQPKPVVSNDPPYKPGENFDRDVVRFARCLPSNPEDAIGATTYAAQWGVSTSHMLRCLRNNNKAICLNGWKNAAGHCVYNSWCLAVDSMN
jgi:hypothetical protein